MSHPADVIVIGTPPLSPGHPGHSCAPLTLTSALVWWFKKLNKCFLVWTGWYPHDENIRPRTQWYWSRGSWRSRSWTFTQVKCFKQNVVFVSSCSVIAVITQTQDAPAQKMHPSFSHTIPNLWWKLSPEENGPFLLKSFFGPKQVRHFPRVYSDPLGYTFAPPPKKFTLIGSFDQYQTCSAVNEMWRKVFSLTQRHQRHDSRIPITTHHKPTDGDQRPEFPTSRNLQIPANGRG